MIVKIRLQKRPNINDMKIKKGLSRLFEQPLFWIIACYQLCMEPSGAVK